MKVLIIPEDQALDQYIGNREKNEEQAAARQREHPGKLLACVAQQEVEVWMLALYPDRLDTKRFTEVRKHCDPKERWADPLLQEIGRDGPGRGRKRAMRALAGNWRSLSSRCPELAALQTSVRGWRAPG